MVVQLLYSKKAGTMKLFFKSKTLYSRLHILDDFGRYLRLLKPLNFNHSHQSGWRSTLQNGGYEFCSICINLVIPPLIMLAIWCVIENGGDVAKLVVVLPIQTSILQMELTFIAFIVKNRIVNETIVSLQNIIDRRKSHAVG